MFTFKQKTIDWYFFKSYSWVHPLDSPSNSISLFQIRYLLKKETKYYQVILCFKKKKIAATEKRIKKILLTSSAKY